MKNKFNFMTFVSMFLLCTILLYSCGNIKKTDTIETENIVNQSKTDTDSISEKEPSDTLDNGQQETVIEEKQVEEMNNEEKGEEKVAMDDNFEEMRDIPSTQLIKEIRIGWNLGNTLDAMGGGNTLSAETSWGNPVTTKEMIDTVRGAGFNTIRIPVSWGNHLSEGPDYIIDEEWINRVQEVVNYGIDNKMFVIINLHHEEWHFPSYDNLENAKNQLIKVWEQIAERFQGYDEHLIFEGMNEPRMFGTEFEWNGGNEEGRDVVNQLNAAFVDTIRKSAGNNPIRHLMIPSYAASSDLNVWKDLIVPDEDKIIVSVHAYTPYNFALNGQGTAEWSIDKPSDTREIDSLMSNIDQFFLSKGIPVIIGEFGARNKDNLKDRVSWSEYYIKAANDKGIPCIWWDNGAFSGEGENFGLLRRRTNSWLFPDIVEALMKGLE